GGGLCVEVRLRRSPEMMAEIDRQDRSILAGLILLHQPIVADDISAPWHPQRAAAYGPQPEWRRGDVGRVLRPFGSIAFQKSARLIVRLPFESVYPAKLPPRVTLVGSAMSA